MQQNDLISRKAVLEELEWLKSNVSESSKAEVDEYIQRVKNATAVEAKPVVHGRWEQVGDYYVCGDYCYRCTNCMTDEWMTFGHMKRFLCFPFCGAKMDGKSNVPRADAEIDFDYEAED